MDFRYVKKEFIDPSLIEDIQNSLKYKITPYNGNADDLIETGFYSITGADLTNKGFPVNLSNVEGLVEVYKTDLNFVTQKFYFGNTFASNYFVRGRGTNSIWGNWAKVFTEEQIGLGGNTFYVDPLLGTDSKDKGTSSGAGAFKTITYALANIPKTNLNRVSIILAKGNYNEDVTITNFKIGQIYIVGNTRSDTIVKSINLTSCDDVSISKITTTNGFDIRDNGKVYIGDCGKTTSNGVGLYCLLTNLYIYNCEISNCTGAGIRCDNNSIIYLDLVVGTNNLVGIECRGSIVRKTSTTTITGTTAQQVSNGGQII